MKIKVWFICLISMFAFFTKAHTQTNEFPKIWVEAGDRQRILDNINNYQWASDMKDDLIRRVEPTKSSHALDPATFIHSITAKNGAVTSDPDSTSYNEGAQVTLMAYPDEGYWFENWSGDLDATDNPVTVVMDGNKNITANFSLETGLIPSDIPTEVKVFPNPSRRVFTVHMASVTGGSYMVYALSGRPVMDGTINEQFEIDMDASVNGIYLLKLITDKGVVWHKIVLEN